MNQWVTYNCSKKKVRGIKRKSRTFLNYITEQTDALPISKNSDPDYSGYTYLHLNFDDFFPDSRKTPNSVRRMFLQTVINRIQHLISTKTELQREYRIFCVFSLPNFVGAKIVILYTKKGLESFYEGFFSREAEGHKIISLQNDLESDWGLHLQKGLDVKGYEIEGENSPDGLWLIGELH
ncbi:DUF3916 domain-containing protein [Bacillus salipaludis]|uniref:DUF3916 domain-containing protein n=1 Tax=Bacillus salipaludis TaxID=2547811 RepID=A0A4R5VSM2_9BACI|nr:DUF3916 domain-containing protein [Bacillus salipaludis]TDK61769.1 DUF3916 domain-containing protein [Bacillus salipaludis]